MKGRDRVYLQQMLEAMATAAGDEFVEAHRDLPLIAAVSMRNSLIHEYEDIDIKVVWDTASVDLPKLGEAIESLL